MEIVTGQVNSAAVTDCATALASVQAKFSDIKSGCAAKPFDGEDVRVGVHDPWLFERTVTAEKTLCGCAPRVLYRVCVPLLCACFCPPQVRCPGPSTEQRRP